MEKCSLKMKRTGNIVALTCLIPVFLYILVNDEITRSVARRTSNHPIYMETPENVGPLDSMKKKFIANKAAKNRPGQNLSAEDTLKKITREVQKIKPKDITAVLHIGPMKTGSTSIQSIFPLLRDVLPKDNYELANYNWYRDLGRQAINFVSCFQKDDYGSSKRFRGKIDQTHRRLLLAKDMDCYEETLQATLDIAKRGHNVLISAEYLPIPKRDVKALRDFMRPWKKVEVIAFYRRYYDWLISFVNQMQKEHEVPERVSLIDFVKQKMTSDDDPLDKWYTVGSVKRFKEYFDNVKVYNMHNIADGDSREEFYCNALPNAPNTCREVRAKKAADALGTSNPSRAVVYEDLAYYAKEMGLWSSRDGITVRDAAILVEKYQEVVLGKSSYDFVGKECPGEKVLSWLREKSWEAEKQLFPEYFEKQGKKEIAEAIEKVRYTKLCHIDVKKTLKDPKWQEFFKKL